MKIAVRARRALQLLRWVLLEIFDEAAYKRFLERHQCPSSSVSYRDFCREQELTQSRRPRCC
jgi:hypothetical protein